MNRKKIAIVTGNRADYGVLYWVIKRIDDDPDLELSLVVTGTHLSQEFGYTAQQIRQDGFVIADEVEMLLSSDTGTGMGKSIGLGIIGLTDSFSRLSPNLVMILGDRFEMLAVAIAAMALSIPIAHFSGGDSTEGAIDEQIRHAISKIAHIHFPGISLHANRLKQMGENPERIFVVGEPGLYHISNMEWMNQSKLSEIIGVDFYNPTAIVTFHPVTLEVNNTQSYIENLVTALGKCDLNYVITYPNSDPGSQVIIQYLKKFVANNRSRAVLHKSLGQKLYLNVLRNSYLMIGNSSSGIIEAPSFNLPTVNIGTRQEGRLRAQNVIDTGYSCEDILAGIEKALSTDFRRALERLVNPYGDGHTGERVIQILKNLDFKECLRKHFYDYE